MAIDVETSGGVPSTTLSSGIITAATSIPLTSGTGFPDGTGGDFYIVIDRGLSTQETVKCASRAGNTITVASGGRGADGSTDQAHDSGATVEHVAAAETIQALITHADQTTGTPHGSAYVTSSGNVATASALETARTISLAGDVTGNTSFDGSGNVSITATVGDDSHDHATSITGSAAYLTSNVNVKPQAAFASAAPQTLTTSPADITGCSITVTTPRANMLYVVIGTFDVDIDYTATLAQGQFVGQLQLDGVDRDGDARLYYNLRDTGDFLRATVTQTWVVDMGTAASHTLKLRGYDSGAGTVQVRALVDTNIAIVHAYG